MTRAEVLKQFGITDRSQMRVREVQEKDKLWLVGINGIGDPIKAIPAKKAQELSIQLRQIGENNLAAEISTAAQKANQANNKT